MPTPFHAPRRTFRALYTEEKDVAKAATSVLETTTKVKAFRAETASFMKLRRVLHLDTDFSLSIFNCAQPIAR
ncbi:hypothetical protein Vadar_003821 [Vaccinium darrowii]|uniref:Uncharacterized protein n=1 Tax=Vaccinium darrowii TaxID=229202 RepID=A0ACB7YJJ8_9ERIC|nr:hypothetical protein Vadar_003821 [Vaccinium darrowii]